MQLEELEGKKALITGSKHGIGRGIAVLLAKYGVDVGINDIEYDQAARDTVNMVRNEGRNVSWHLADITKSSEIDRLFNEFIEEHGRIDIMINNAVDARLKPFLEITEDDWDFGVDIALKSYFLCSQRAAREMVGQGTGGRIVSISSVHAFRTWPTALVYGVCKAAIIRMHKSMAVDLKGHNINCNSIAPGYIDSRILPPEQEHLRGDITLVTKSHGNYKKAINWIPTQRIGVPEDIARAVVFLCSSLGDYVNGQCIPVDGGFLAGGTPDSH